MAGASAPACFMSTWLELKKNALTLLDIDPEATTADDLRTAVDQKFQFSRDRLYNVRVPDSLLVSSNEITIDGTTEYILISGTGDSTHPSFALTDFKKIFALKIEDETWAPTRWASWIRQKSGLAGDQRFRKSYAVDGERNIWLRSSPGAAQTWTGVLHYQKEAATIVDGGTPEIGEEHEELLVVDVVRGFPNRFITEERLALLSHIDSRYHELLRAYKADSVFGQPNLRLKPYVRDTSQRSVINWGEGDL